VVGTGHAEKAQIAMMVRTLLPGSGGQGADAADALAAAITHARVRAGAKRIAQGVYTHAKGESA
jgi:crossover junction endodeoxyribonuclease RuvC